MPCNPGLVTNLAPRGWTQGESREREVATYRRTPIRVLSRTITVAFRVPLIDPLSLARLRGRIPDKWPADRRRETTGTWLARDAG